MLIRDEEHRHAHGAQTRKHSCSWEYNHTIYNTRRRLAIDHNPLKLGHKKKHMVAIEKDDHSQETPSKIFSNVPNNTAGTLPTASLTPHTKFCGRKLCLALANDFLMLLLLDIFVCVDASALPFGNALGGDDSVIAALYEGRTVVVDGKRRGVRSEGGGGEAVVRE